MTAAPETEGPANFGDWFAERFTIVVEPEDPSEPSEDLTPTAPAARTGWASLFTAIKRHLPGWLGGVSDPPADPTGPTPPATSHPKNLIQVDKLEGASKWAAGGFSAATALLLFFGVKEGVLDQAIRLNPFATLCVFLLLGVGVLCALFAGAINPVKRIRVWTLLTAVAIMLFLTALFLPNLDIASDVKDALDYGSAIIESTWLRRIILLAFNLLVAAAVLAVPLFASRVWDNRNKSDDPSDDSKATSRQLDWVLLGASVLILLFALVIAIGKASTQTLLSVTAGTIFLAVIAWSFAGKWELPAVAAVIVLGVAATSLGLYGAAKLSVGTKLVAVDPQVSSSLEQADGQMYLKIAAVASRMRDAKLVISVAGVPRIQEAELREVTGTASGEIWRSVLQPNSLDEINTTVTVPLAPTRWELVTVSHCQVDNESVGEGEGREPARTNREVPKTCGSGISRPKPALRLPATSLLLPPNP